MRYAAFDVPGFLNVARTIANLFRQHGETTPGKGRHGVRSATHQIVEVVYLRIDVSNSCRDHRVNITKDA